MIYRTKLTCKNEARQWNFQEAAFEQNQSVADRRLKNIFSYHTNLRWQERKIYFGMDPWNRSPLTGTRESLQRHKHSILLSGKGMLRKAQQHKLHSLPQRPLNLHRPPGPAPSYEPVPVSVPPWRWEAWGLCDHYCWQRATSMNCWGFFCRSKITSFHAWKQNKEKNTQLFYNN